ncbi:apoptosis regulator BAX-like [Aplochiton taeniatus]
MASEGNGTSDERIGEALIKVVIEEELKDVAAEDVPPFTPMTKEVQTEQERKIVTQLGEMIRIIGDKVKDDKEFQDAIDGMASGPGSPEVTFSHLVNKVLESGPISWERIALLFYVAGRVAVKMVQAHLPQLVKDILKWTLEVFRTRLLGWVREHGGWINSFSELARCQVERMTSLSSQRSVFLLIFIVGLTLGSFITWRVARRT